MAAILLCSCSPVKKVTMQEYFIQENGGNYIGALAVADGMMSSKCMLHFPNIKKSWANPNQVMYEFKSVLTSQLIANRPYIKQELIEQQIIEEIFEGSFERSINQTKERFKLLNGSREECAELYKNITMHLTVVQWQWEMIRDNSYWGRIMDDYRKKEISKNNGTFPAKNIIPKLTYDELLAGFQRIDFFRKQRDNGYLSNQEFQIKRSAILRSLI
jgi:hypothetical protein